MPSRFHKKERLLYHFASFSCCRELIISHVLEIAADTGAQVLLCSPLKVFSEMDFPLLLYAGVELKHRLFSCFLAVSRRSSLLQSHMSAGESKDCCAWKISTVAPISHFGRILLGTASSHYPSGVSWEIIWLQFQIWGGKWKHWLFPLPFESLLGGRFCSGSRKLYSSMLQTKHGNNGYVSLRAPPFHPYALYIWTYWQQIQLIETILQDRRLPRQRYLSLLIS
jgi:hypothetical protein